MSVTSRTGRQTGPNFFSRGGSVARYLRGQDKLDQSKGIAYVIMPNHVHLLIEPNVALERITNGLKGVTAREANRILKRTGQPFWQDESFDHWVRSLVESRKIAAYIENNPVKAKLVTRPENWPWSSASTKGVQTTSCPKSLAEATALRSEPGPHER